MTAAPLCPECRDATRKHDDVGCRVPGCFCGQTRATLAAALDELPAPAVPEPVPPPPAALVFAEPTPPSNGRRPERSEDKRAEAKVAFNLGTLYAERNTILMRLQHREPTEQERQRLAELNEEIRTTKATGEKPTPSAAEVPDASTPAGTDPAADDSPLAAEATDFPADPAADDAPLDSPAGEDGEVSGVAPQPAQGDLPGTSPAPVDSGHEAAAAPPVSGQPAAEDGPPASAAGQLLGSWITWHCPLHLVFVELPYGHADCPTGLIRARVTVRREDADA